MSPKYSYPFGKHEFINPYNFVPVSWKNKEFLSAEKDEDNLISGVMHCSLYTRSPIAIPDTEKKIIDERQHKTYPFMKNPAGKYMIPGSSVRGAIRSVYETITDSCFVTSKVDQRITKRTTIKEAQFFKPSLLVYNQEKKGWELYKAERHLIIIDENAGKDQNCKIKDKNRKYVTLNGYQDHARWNLETLNNHSYGELIPFTPGQEFSKNGIKIGCIIKNIGKGDKTGYLYKGEVLF